MQLADIESLMIRGARSEWVDLEVKRSLAEKEKAMEALCAFLNGDGGHVIFGVEPKSGTIIGGDVYSDATLRLVGDLFHFIEPAPAIRMDRIALADGRREILVLTAEPVPNHRPYVYRGRPYQRVGPSTRVMAQEAYQELLRQRSLGPYGWELQPAPRVTVGDLDHEEIHRTVRLGIAAQRLPEDTVTLSVEQVLTKLDLMRDGVIVNAGVVLFGHPSLGDYPQCQLRLAHFNGITNTAEFLDNPSPVEGNAFVLLRAAEEYLQRRLPIASHFPEGTFERRDESVFPIKVIREAIANAIIHRDYAPLSGAMYVAIYSDRVEITNPGTLLPPLTLEALRGVHPSKLRNPVTANVFYRRGLVEQWGRGTKMIVDLCLDAGHPEPTFFAFGGGYFGVALRSSRALSPRGLVTVTQRQRAILRALMAEESPLRELHRRFPQTGLATLRKELAEMKRAGFITSRGRGASAVWVILSEGAQILQVGSEAIGEE